MSRSPSLAMRLRHEQTAGTKERLECCERQLLAKSELKFADANSITQPLQQLPYPFRRRNNQPVIQMCITRCRSNPSMSKQLADHG